jgi:hypothetical protein
VRSALAAPPSFAANLVSSLQSSSDAQLRTVTGAVATSPTEDVRVQSPEPCCAVCDASLVTLTAGATACKPCPAGSARVNASACVDCPGNSRASPFDVARCACNPGWYDTLFGARLTAPVCEACPPGGVCTSGFVEADAGFWRETTADVQFFACREGRCVAEKVTGPLSDGWDAALALALLGNGTTTSSRRALQQAAPAPWSALQLPSRGVTPANCVEGTAGPLCGVCAPGYAMQSGECEPCDAAEA